MSISRRNLIKLGALAGAIGLSMPGIRAEAAPAVTAKPLRILILGGTGFIGPHQVRYAVSRGHQVTVFTRGRRQADLPSRVELLEPACLAARREAQAPAAWQAKSAGAKQA